MEKKVLNSGDYLEGDRHNEEKKVIIDTKKEFDILKKSTLEFDLFKEKINSLNLSLDKSEKIISYVGEYFYKAENTEEKLKVIKLLNEYLDKIIPILKSGSNSKEILERFLHEHNYFMSDKMRNLSLKSALGLSLIISAMLIVFIGVLAAAAVYSFSSSAAIFISYLSGVSAFGTVSYGSYNLISSMSSLDKIIDLNKSINSLYDIINDFYPDISKEEFEMIFSIKNNFDYKKFNDILSKFYEDGKISDYERTVILDFIKKQKKISGL